MLSGARIFTGRESYYDFYVCMGTWSVYMEVYVDMTPGAPFTDMVLL